MLTDFEKQRLQNIERNKNLLRSLDLDSVASSFKQPTPKPKPKPSRPRKREPVEPQRKSRRLAGIKTEQEDPEEFARQQAEKERVEAEKAQLERLKKTRLLGEFSLIDLLTDEKGGYKNEDRVLKREKNEQEKEEEVKKEEKEVKKEVENDQDINDIKDEDINENVLSLIKSLGDKFSAGDFYDVIRTKTGADVSSIREEFDRLRIHARFDPLDIKLSHYRITSINFHPSTENRVVAAGDTNGNLGIWAVDDTKDEPSTTIVKPHGKSISKILTPSTDFSKIYTGSYDGSVRVLDMNKTKSSELAYLSEDGEELGISDINMPIDSPLLYMSTLSGLFLRYDTREPFKQGSLLRMHDKKIGGFSINPNANHQVATSSLDRTMRIWDLRNTGPSSWSEFDDQTSPHLYGSYGSRLSVSTVDWNADNRLVCNGYDDKINLFDLPAVSEWKRDYVLENSEGLVPVNTIRHNCQTGRWVSILKARWQTKPEDGINKFVIANMNRGLDVYDQNGEILAHLTESVGAVPAVATLHPVRNWVVGGSASGKIYLFEPSRSEGESE